MQESGRAQNLEDESFSSSDIILANQDLLCQHEIDDLWGGEKCKFCGVVFIF
jgi:hypothetical protein